MDTMNQNIETVNAGEVELTTPSQTEFNFDNAMRESFKAPIENDEPQNNVEVEVVEPQEPSTNKQSAEDNSKYAQARREAEAEKAKIIAEREADAKDAGFESYADMQKYIKQQKEAAKQQEFQQTYGVDMSVVSEAFKATPEYQEFMADKQSRESQKLINDSIAELNTEFPELKIKSIEDVVNLPNYDKIYDLVTNKGKTLTDAYLRVNYMNLAKDTAEVAKQATLNAMNSKSHLKSNTGTMESDPVVIDNDTLEIFKKFGFTEEQARKNYKK